LQPKSKQKAYDFAEGNFGFRWSYIQTTDKNNPLAHACPTLFLQLLLHKIIVSSLELLSHPEIKWLKNDLQIKQ